MMKNIFTICVLALFFIGCEDDDNINPSGLIENTVDISGNWQVASVTQNNIDITNQFDFQSLGLTFKNSGDTPSTFTKTGTSNIPFPFSMTDGAFSFDDLVYPTKLNFSGSEDITMELAELPLVSKGKDFKLRVTLGCSDNIYVYSFKKK
ncbi:DUF5004 domain-containing protein [Flavivirga eckloniae]|uniref:DUF5004 domain-containing protein n=1 Tax=Flavivirga eckloniae TaxID=1803846 RepID=A0A2K9PUB8_9FLAO|nr:DUF5004 domain-containing protein [Flavivirga eckloniae]AUP80639.1 hypothetical protein C1H87_18745 [Flavivirga eckloniae]